MNLIDINDSSRILFFVAHDRCQDSRMNTIGSRLAESYLAPAPAPSFSIFGTDDTSVIFHTFQIYFLHLLPIP